MEFKRGLVSTAIMALLMQSTSCARLSRHGNFSAGREPEDVAVAIAQKAPEGTQMLQTAFVEYDGDGDDAKTLEQTIDQVSKEMEFAK